MSRFAWTTTLLTALVAMLPAGLAPAQGPSTGAITLQKALDKPVDMEIKDAPIGDVFVKLKDATGAKFEVADETMDFLPYGDQTRLAVTLKNVTLRKALTPMLAPQALQWTIDNDVIRVSPADALFRLGRRATYDELRTLGTIMSQKLTPTAEGGAVIEQLRKLTGEKELALVFHSDLDRQLAMQKAERALPGTAADWLDVLCHGQEATWYVSGTNIVVVDKLRQVERQLQRTVTLKYQNEKLTTVLLDLSRKAHLKVSFEPGVMALLPPEMQSNYNMMMSQATIAQALEVISGATGLGFARTGDGIRVEASEALGKPRASQPAAGTAAAAQKRSPFFLRFVMPGPENTTVEVFIRAEDLPQDVIDSIMAERAKVLDRIKPAAAAKKSDTRPAVTEPNPYP